MSKKAHDPANKKSLKVIVPNKVDDERFGKIVSSFSHMVEDEGLFEQMARAARYMKPSQRAKQKAFSKRKNRRGALAERAKLEAKYYHMSVIK